MCALSASHEAKAGQYAWDFGDTQTASGAQVTHRYGEIGAYTATVTATNSLGSLTATTLVSIEPLRVYLPLVLR
jgi:PKD repeat protein